MDTLFPADRRLEITADTRPLTQTSTIAVFVQLAEDRLFVQGFDENERVGRPPTLLRGSLVIRVMKPARIKSINLTFTGQARTDWPEGIPPKRSEFYEENMLINHTWPFFTAGGASSSGADLVKSPSNALVPIASNGSASLFHEEMSTLSLDSIMGGRSPIPSNPLALLKRVASPSPERARRRSASVFSQESQTTTTNTGEYVFQPGDYIYNFEHPVPASSPESIDATFGSVNYHLQVHIERYGAFKSNISTRMPIQVVRSQSDDSVEDSEPIAISRDWEDQLHYDIIIASKAMVLNAYIPIAFKLVPLDKIKLHRIRIYVTENMEYYCRNKKVHRMQPVKKFLLLEHKAPPPPDLPEDADPKLKKMGNLLTSDGYDLTAKEFEFQVYVPEKLNSLQKLHPNTTYQNVKIHHWIKICLRLSRVIDGKPKHYEISIDSPIHILHPLCSHANTLLPAYGPQDIDAFPQNHQSNIYFPMDVLNSPPLSPEVEAFDHTPHTSIYLALGRDANRGRSRSNSTLNHSLPNFESTLSANVYKPTNLEIELTSPQAVPLSPQLLPQPFMLEDMSVPPPAFESIVFARSASPPMLPRGSGNSHSSIGIDAIMDAGSPPLNPPDYEELMKKESRVKSLEADAPDITVTRSSESPESMKRGDPGDLGDDFAFSGISPIMPEGVMRATSPERQRARAIERSAHASPRVSLDLNRSDLTLGASRQHDIDAVLSHGVESEVEEDENDQDDHRSRFSSRSSFSPSRTEDYETELTDMQPLLHTTSTSSELPFGSRDGFASRWESRESLTRRESASVDITALYQSTIPSFSRTSVFDSSTALNSLVSGRHPSIDASAKRPSMDSRRGSTIVTNPILATLTSEPVIDEENESVKTKSEESSIKDNQSSHSTLTSTNDEHGTPAIKKQEVVEIPSATPMQQEQLSN